MRLRLFRYAVRLLNWLKVIILLLSSSTYSLAGNVNEYSGITLPSTRIIYSGKETKGITFAVTNNTPTPYLMQSRVTTLPTSLVEEAHDTPSLATSPFIVLPPLVRIESGETTTLRIRLIQNTLPTNKESVFAFQIKTIPSKKKREDNAKEQAHMTLALQNTLKMFYRPEGLPPYKVQNVAQALQFKRQGTQITVTNPTVFYATFADLSVGKSIIGNKALLKMVPPLGQQTYSLPDIEPSGDVRWQLLNEYGIPTEPMTRPLDNQKNNHRGYAGMLKSYCFSLTNNLSAKKQYAYHPLVLALCLGCPTALAEDYFDPAFLGSSTSVDLSAFSEPGGVAEGEYTVTVFMNEQAVGNIR